MSYKALYRTYRPALFEDVVGQDHIIKTLKNSIAQNKIAHAYLFCGPRGTGKTSVAKLLAKAVNCTSNDLVPCGECPNCLEFQNGDHPDVIEMDAASNNGVDEIRELIEKVKYMPIQGRYKIYIIDEVHMLSSSAFNALLKTLEEPPSHIIFILATTDPQKVLPTIISRCQRYNFSKVDNKDMTNLMKNILEKEKIKYEDEAINLIADLSDGGMRDALSILDQCIAYGQNTVSAKDVNFIYGITTTDEKILILDDIKSKNIKSLISKIRDIQNAGIDIKRLTDDLVTILKESVIYETSKDETLLTKCSKMQVEKINNIYSINELLEMIDILVETSTKYKTAFNTASYFEIAVLNMVNLSSRTESKVGGSLNQSEFINQNKTINKSENKIDDKKEIVDEDYFDQNDIQEENSNFESIDEQEKIDDSTIVLDEDFLLGLLVGGNKDIRTNDSSVWEDIKNKCRDINYAKCANLLKETKIIACSDDYLLIEANYKELANEINELKTNQELYNFIRKELKLDKMVYAISKDESAGLVNEFLIRRESKTLPSRSTIKKYSIEDTIEIDPKEKTINKLIDVFGEDIVEIKEK